MSHPDTANDPHEPRPTKPGATTPARREPPTVANRVMTRTPRTEPRDDRSTGAERKPGLAVTVYAVPPTAIPRGSRDAR